MMHGFSTGDGPRSRAAAAPVHGRRSSRPSSAPAGTDEQVRDFVAHGMLLNVMLSMRAPEHLEPGDPLTALATCAFGDALEVLQSPA